MMSLRHVSFRYAECEYGVADIDFSVGAGECVVLIGASGCGKTTVTRLVNALAPSYYPGTRTGTITVGGKELSDLPVWEVGRSVGSVFQDPRRQFFSSELRGEVAFACENYGLPQGEIRRRTDSAIRRMKLERLQGRPLDVLSGGEKQRAAIASVYALRPGVFVFDEPTANLDTVGISELRETLLELKSEGCALLVAEHRISWLDGVADRYIYMADGRIEGSYAPEEMRSMSETERIAKGLRAVTPVPIRAFGASAHGDSAHGDFAHGDSAHGDLAHGASAHEETGALRASNLSCRRGKAEIVRGVSMNAERGMVSALTGRNGIGKTTLAMALSGLIRTHGGRIDIGGTTMSRSKLRQLVYYCSNDTMTQFFTNSVAEELLLNKPRTEQERARARTQLERMKLYPWKDAHPATLSGGQRQRLAVACALLSDKDILIVDEPTSGLDGKNMRLIADELRAATRDGKTVLVITHDEELINLCCDRRIHIDEMLEAGQ